MGVIDLKHGNQVLIGEVSTEVLKSIMHLSYL